MTVRLTVMLMLLAMLTACQGATETAPTPTTSVLAVRVTAGLRSLAPQLQACAEGLPNTGLALLDSADRALPAGLSLRWGADPAPEDYAAVIGEEALAVIVHPDNPLTSISVTDLRSIYQGALFEWEDFDGEIEAWAYPLGSDTLHIFENRVMNNETVNRHAAGTLPEPGAMLETVAGSPSAIGFIPQRWMNETVKAITVEGLLPEQLRAPVLALSEGEPHGVERSWLICLQEALK